MVIISVAWFKVLEHGLKSWENVPFTLEFRVYCLKLVITNYLISFNSFKNRSFTETECPNVACFLSRV